MKTVTQTMLLTEINQEIEALGIKFGTRTKYAVEYMEQITEPKSYTNVKTVLIVATKRNAANAKVTVLFV